MEKIKKPLGSIMIGYRNDLWENICDPVLYEVLFSNIRFFESIKKEGYDISECVKKKIDSSLKK